MTRRISLSGTSEVTVVCHRGANHVAPENTYAAAAQCIAWGAQYVEVDVRTSKDGVFYILHDATVDRTTNGSGPLRELRSNEIDLLDAGGWFDPMFAGERLPRLVPYLRWISGKAGVFFDVKDADLERLLPIVYAAGLKNHCFFWFSDDAEAHRCRHLAPDLALKVNASNPAEALLAYENFEADIIEVGVEDFTWEMQQTCHEKDMLVMVATMRKDTSAFRKIIEQKADMVNLDHPDAFLAMQHARRATVP